MFIEADFDSIQGSFITDDRAFLDSFYEEALDMLERIKERPKKVSDFKEYIKQQYMKTKEEAIWFALELRHPPGSNVYLFGRRFNEDLFAALLYKKASEFGYDLKAATKEGHRQLNFMKPSAPTK